MNLKRLTSRFRRDRFIAMQQFRDTHGYTKLYCMTKHKVFEYDVERKVWHEISATIAKKVAK